MGKIIKRNFKIRLLICIAIISLSFLFIGAGQVTHELSGRKDSRKIENKKWSKILREMETEVPSEYKEEWEEIAALRPESLMHAVSFIKK